MSKSRMFHFLPFTESGARLGDAIAFHFSILETIIFRHVSDMSHLSFLRSVLLFLQRGEIAR
jgi:hypothetical protein